MTAISTHMKHFTPRFPARLLSAGFAVSVILYPATLAATETTSFGATTVGDAISTLVLAVLLILLAVVGATWLWSRVLSPEQGTLPNTLLYFGYSLLALVGFAAFCFLGSRIDRGVSLVVSSTQSFWPTLGALVVGSLVIVVGIAFFGLLFFVIPQQAYGFSFLRTLVFHFGLILIVALVPLATTKIFGKMPNSPWIAKQTERWRGSGKRAEWALWEPSAPPRASTSRSDPSAQERAEARNLPKRALPSPAPGARDGLRPGFDSPR